MNVQRGPLKWLAVELGGRGSGNAGLPNQERISGDPASPLFTCFSNVIIAVI